MFRSTGGRRPGIGALTGLLIGAAVSAVILGFPVPAGAEEHDQQTHDGGSGGMGQHDADGHTGEDHEESGGGKGGGHDDGGGSGGEQQQTRAGPGGGDGGGAGTSKSKPSATKPAWAQEGIPEGELGRLNVARSPDRVLERAYLEALASITPSMAAFYNQPIDSMIEELSLDWDNVSFIDSPLQNLALLRDALDAGIDLSALGISNDDRVLMAVFLGTDQVITHGVRIPLVRY